MKKFISLQKMLMFLAVFMLHSVMMNAQLPLSGSKKSGGGGDDPMLWTNIENSFCLDIKRSSVKIEIYNHFTEPVIIPSIIATHLWDGSTNQLVNNNNDYLGFAGNELIAAEGTNTFILHFESPWNIYHTSAEDVLLMVHFEYYLESDIPSGNNIIFVIPKTDTYIMSNYKCGLDKPLPERLSNEESTSIINSVKIAPNPATDNFNISFDMNEEEDIDIKLYNSIGQEVKVIINEAKAKGKHTENVSISDLDAGIYYVRIASGSEYKTEKIVKL